MSMWDWLRSLLHGKPLTPHPDPAKVELNQRQLDVADRLSKIRGETRDEVLAEAYRRADRIVRRR